MPGLPRDDRRQTRWLGEQYPQMCALLSRWANVNSGSDHVAGLERMAGLVRASFAELGGPVDLVPLADREVIDEAGNVQRRPLGPAIRLQSPPRAGLRILLGIHMDTVFDADHPFQQVRNTDEQTLRGPGVADAKGGLVVLLYALLAFERSPAAAGIRWEVLINPDEELGSPGSAPLWEAAARRNDLGLLFEPALPDGALVSARRGSGNWTVVARGRTAHVGRDFESGRNAIHALARFIAGVSQVGAQHGVTVNVGFVHGGGPVNVVPDVALCRLNMRVDTAEDAARVRTVLAECAANHEGDGVRLELRGGFHCPPKPADEATTWWLEQLRSCADDLGFTIRWRGTGGACDGNRLAAAGLPTIDSLGVCGGDIHTDREFVHLPSLVDRASLTASLLIRLGSGEIAVPTAYRRKEVAP